MIPVDGETMLEIAPRFSGKLGKAQAAIVKEVGPLLSKTLEAYQIDTRLRIAHFLAQICHESAGFRTTEEFASGDAYEGRKDLGNTKPGDGRRYKGRGLLQLTGRANYRAYGAALGVDLETDPRLAAEPRLSLRIACEYWKKRRVNAMCERDDLIAVTKAVNGGLNGLDDRRQLVVKAKAAIARIEGLQLTRAATGGRRPVLQRGSGGQAVGELQRMLRTLGYPMAIDDDFGAATELAVMRVQADQHVRADGIVGPETWKALAAAVKKSRAKRRVPSA